MRWIIILLLFFPHIAYATQSGSISANGSVTMNDFNKTFNVSISNGVTVVWKTNTDGLSATMAAKHLQSPNAFGSDTDWNGLYLRIDIGRNSVIQPSHIPDPNSPQNDFTSDANWN